jgi:hypothetical protein
MFLKQKNIFVRQSLYARYDAVFVTTDTMIHEEKNSTFRTHTNSDVSKISTQKRRLLLIAVSTSNGQDTVLAAIVQGRRRNFRRTVCVLQ